MRLFRHLLSSLLMPVRTQDGLATHLEIEGTMINHPFEGIFLKLGSSSVYCGPRLQLRLRLHLWATPVHQWLAVLGLDDHEVAIIVFSGDFPGPLIEPRPVVKGPDFSGLKTLDAVRLIVVEHAKQAQARLVKGLGDGLRLQRPVNHEEIASGNHGHLLTVGHNEL